VALILGRAKVSDKACNYEEALKAEGA